MILKKAFNFYNLLIIETILNLYFSQNFTLTINFKGLFGISLHHFQLQTCFLFNNKVLDFLLRRWILEYLNYLEKTVEPLDPNSWLEKVIELNKYLCLFLSIESDVFPILFVVKKNLHFLNSVILKCHFLQQHVKLKGEVDFNVKTYSVFRYVEFFSERVFYIIVTLFLNFDLIILVKVQIAGMQLSIFIKSYETICY
jgi:hypothetical protein